MLLACTTSFSQEAQKRQITPAQIDAVFSQWDTPDKPGIAVGVLNDGEITYTKGYGLANLEHQNPISAETRFHIGDLAKEFTVYALLLIGAAGPTLFTRRYSKAYARINVFSKYHKHPTGDSSYEWIE